MKPIIFFAFDGVFCWGEACEPSATGDDALDVYATVDGTRTCVQCLGSRLTRDEALAACRAEHPSREIVSGTFRTSNAERTSHARSHHRLARVGEVSTPCPSHEARALGYLAWHDDATQRHRRGERQRRCPKCLLWFWPHEFGDAMTAARNRPRGMR